MDKIKMDESMIEKMECYAPTVVRIAMSLVFLWFGSQQLLHTDVWTSFIPASAVSMSGMSAATLVHFNGAFEIIFGICLLVGYFTRISALLLGIHLLGIMFSIGYNAVGVRDFGLAFATLSIFLSGGCCWSVDQLSKSK